MTEYDPSGFNSELFSKFRRGGMPQLMWVPGRNPRAFAAPLYRSAVTIRRKSRTRFAAPCTSLRDFCTPALGRLNGRLALAVSLFASFGFCLPGTEQVGIERPSGEERPNEILGARAEMDRMRMAVMARLMLGRCVDPDLGGRV